MLAQELDYFFYLFQRLPIGLLTLPHRIEYGHLQDDGS
jgi:hypothetical protein